MKTNKHKHHIIDKIVNLNLKKKFADKYKFKLNYIDNIYNIEFLNEFTKVVNESGYLLVTKEFNKKEIRIVNKLVRDTIQAYYRCGLLFQVTVCLSTEVKEKRENYTLFDCIYDSRF